MLFCSTRVVYRAKLGARVPQPWCFCKTQDAYFVFLSSPTYPGVVVHLSKECGHTRLYCTFDNDIIIIIVICFDIISGFKGLLMLISATNVSRPVCTLLSNTLFIEIKTSHMIVVQLSRHTL